MSSPWLFQGKRVRIMPTSAQMLAGYPEILLQVIAELRGAWIEGAETRGQAIELLAAQLSDPTSVQMAYQEMCDESAQAETAIQLLLRTHGEIAEAQFSREFGAIRQMGPARLEREAPWLYPENVAELLYYNGLIGRGFKGAGQQAYTYIYLPSDITPWLPRPQSELPVGLPLHPTAPPPPARTLLADDALLLDLGALLGFVYHEPLRLTPTGHHPDDLSALAERLQTPFEPTDREGQTRLLLLLHLAQRLGWLRREGDRAHLAQNQVAAFLEKKRPEQRRLLFESWRDSPEWNDLCRTPELECVEAGLWQNDPLQTRSAVLLLLSHLQPGAWYAQTDLIEAVRTVEPDFQRPTGDYDTWYLRSSSTQEFLKGFERWNEVEGALLRFLVRGPLAWLAVLDRALLEQAEAVADGTQLLSLSSWGARWLGHEVPDPGERLHDHFQIAEDFTVTLASGVSLADRFRVERFAQWQQSSPLFVYRITQRSLKRASERGISGARIADFLRKRAPATPARVLTALERFAGNG